jgi:Zn-dependent peptidase ImmA (M78 family)
LFPDVIFRRWRDQVEASWGQSPISGMPEGFRFVAEQGMRRIDPRSVAAALHAVASEATSYLVSRLPSSHRLRALNQRIERLRETKNTDERLMWLAGLGVDVRSVRQGWQRISKVAAGFGRAAEKLLTPREIDPLVVGGSCHAALMFGSVSPQVGTEDVTVLARSLIELSRSNGDPPNLSRHVRSEPSVMEVAWNRGYRLAEELLGRLGRPANGDVTIDIHGILKSLGIEIRDVQLDDESIRGVSVAGPGHRPAILINRTHDANGFPSGYRFSLAHELCHILHDRSAGVGLALASGPWAPRDVERRANAFAAMLLMPRALIERASGASAHETGSLEWVLDIARTLKTSIRATLPHLRNLGYIDEGTEERIQTEVQARAGLHDEGE